MPGDQPQDPLPPVRMIATDLDGTVLGPDFLVRPRTVRAIKLAREAGIHVVFVTGRPRRWLAPVIEQFEDVGTVICSNGAVVYDPSCDEVLDSFLFDAADAWGVMHGIALHHPGTLFSMETLNGVYSDPGWALTERLETNPHDIPPLQGTVADDVGVVKFLAKLDQADPGEYFQSVRRIVAGRLAATHSVADTPLVEMGQRGLTKARTLERYAAKQGISGREVMAFGDMLNDLEMLTWAGRGYAMADGHPTVIRAVGRTAPPFSEDGVAQVIEAYLHQQS